jgi:hypothetical protein
MHTVLLNYMGITQAGGAMKSSLNLLLAGGLSFISACKIRQCARPAMPTDNSPGFLESREGHRAPFPRPAREE